MVRLALAEVAAHCRGLSLGDIETGLDTWRTCSSRRRRHSHRTDLTRLAYLERSDVRPRMRATHFMISAEPDRQTSRLADNRLPRRRLPRPGMAANGMD